MTQQSKGDPDYLPPRLARVVDYVALGLSHRTTAAELGLCEQTVQNYCHEIYERLGLSSKLELAMWAVRKRSNSKLC